MLNGMERYFNHPGYLTVVNAAPAAWKLATEGDIHKILPFYAGPNATDATVQNKGFNYYPGIAGQMIEIFFTTSDVFTEEYRQGLVTMFGAVGINVDPRDVKFNSGRIKIQGLLDLPSPTN